MRVFTEHVGAESAILIGYVLDHSDELLNARVRPAVLVLPGGGYFMTSDREAEPVALAYLAEGFNAFVLRYAVGDDARSSGHLPTRRLVWPGCGTTPTNSASIRRGLP